MAGKSSSKKALIWVIPLLAIIGFGGFGAVNFSGRLSSIGTVGDTDIPADTYAFALRNELRAAEAQSGERLSVEQARQLGLTDRVLAQVVTNAALDDESARIGLSVGDDQVAQELRGYDAFQGADGSFDREAYGFALRNAGLTESEFEAQLRNESARALLQAAVAAGNALPETYVDTLLAYAGETRDFTWALQDQGALTTGLAVATDEELQAWYEDNITLFTRPETKAITYAWITPEMIVDTVEIDSAALQQAYEERSAEFNLPERRLVERLVFANEAEAQDAADRLSAGDTDFDALVSERGLSLADADMGDVTRGDLGEAADLVFGAEVGEVVGPAYSSLGPALYRVNGVLAAQQTPLDEAEPALRDDLALDRARRVIEGMAQSLDDELAGGATLEDLAGDTEMELGQIDWTQQSNAGIAAYPDFNAAAAAVADGDYPAIETLGDGGLFALRLDEIQPPAPAPFEDVRDVVEQGWEAEQASAALVEQLDSAKDQLAAEGGFAEAGLTPRAATGLTRDARVQGLPAGILTEVFSMEQGEVRVLPANGSALVLRLDAIAEVDRDSEQAQALADLLRGQAASSVAQDLFRALNTDIQARAGVQVDQQAVNAILSSIQ